MAWLDGLDDEARGAVRSAAAERAERLLAGWPAPDPARWPRVDEPLRVHLAGGALSIAGRVDAAFDGPPTARPAVLVEVKGGSWRDDHRPDAHLYALLGALRDRAAPRAVVTMCAGDGRVNVEPVREGVLEAAALRVGRAVDVAAALAAGEAPDARPGPYCPGCPALASCEPGRQQVAGTR
jgi:hypothetical protein